jgi:hypothetical protein
MTINFTFTITQGIYTAKYNITAKNWRIASGRALKEFMLDENVLANPDKTINIKTEIQQ